MGSPKYLIMAEREGFEPSLGYKPKHAFQACAINHSATSPDGVEANVIADRSLTGQGFKDPCFEITGLCSK